MASKRKISDRQHRLRSTVDSSSRIIGVAGDCAHVCQSTTSVGTQTHGAYTSTSSSPPPAPPSCSIATAGVAGDHASDNANATPATPATQGVGHQPSTNHRSPLLPREPTAMRISNKEMLTSSASGSHANLYGDKDDRDGFREVAVAPLEPRRPTSSPVRHASLTQSQFVVSERRSRIKSDAGGNGISGTRGADIPGPSNPVNVRKVRYVTVRCMI